jgi:general stress protein 26
MVFSDSQRMHGLNQCLDFCKCFVRLELTLHPGNSKNSFDSVWNPMRSGWFRNETHHPALVAINVFAIRPPNRIRTA